ncbi:MAG: hypothetical protein ACYCTI_09990 [Acidimicrobiales bacterium]
MKVRVLTAGAVGVLGAAMAAGPALAATTVVGPVSISTGAAGTPEVFAGSASGTALKLSIAGQSLTAGISSAQVASNLTAVASAVGQLAPIAATAQQQASVKGNGQVQAPAEECGTPALPSLPAPFPGLTAGLACSSVIAGVKDGQPTAMARGTVADITANAAATFTTVLQPVLAPVQQIFGELHKIAPGLDPATSTVTQLLNVLQNSQTLGLHLGESSSMVQTLAGKVTALNIASGGEVDILGIGGSPVAKIVIGSSQAEAVYDRATGKATPSFNPALVTVTINPLPATGLAAQTLTVAPGQSLTILQGTPLQSTITVADGSSTVNKDGSVTAVADGVSLDLLQGLGASSPTATNGGIDLALAESTASVGGKPAIAPAPVVEATSITPPPITALPFTGSTPTLPLAGAGLLTVGVIGRRLRTWLRRPAG